jgi:uncharacterized membrane protein
MRIIKAKVDVVIAGNAYLICKEHDTFGILALIFSAIAVINYFFVFLKEKKEDVQ